MSEGGGNGTEAAQVVRQVPHDPLIGTVVDGRYHIEAVLGEGGMGIVYKAVHAALGKPLAIKVLRPEVSKNEQIVARFKQEAQSASAIGNQHIIDVSDFGVMPDGSTYFVMEFLTGQSLTHALETGRFTPDRVIRVAKQLSGALGAAHEIGVVHRDLKPDNIQLIARGGQTDFVKILDFGIAKVGGSTSKLTQAGQVFGTPHYMSPEQCAGTAVDQRTDIYALGVILYEMATGRVPFDADNLMGILTKHLYENPIPPHELPPPVDVPPALEAVILRCLAKKPESRYQSMAELHADLERVEQGITPQAVAEQVEFGLLATAAHDASGSITVGFGQPEVPMRRATLPIAIGLGVLLIGGATAFLVLGGSPSSEHIVQPALAPAAPPAPAAVPTPAVVPEPEPEPVPAPPAEPVLVTIRSNPDGAELYRNGVLLGNTPFPLPRPEGAASLALELRLSGHEVKAFSIDSTTSETLTVSLAPVPTPAPTAAKPPRKRTSKPNGDDAPSTGAKPSKPPERRVQTEVLDPWD